MSVTLSESRVFEPLFKSPAKQESFLVYVRATLEWARGNGGLSDIGEKILMRCINKAADLGTTVRQPLLRRQVLQCLWEHQAASPGEYQAARSKITLPHR